MRRLENLYGELIDGSWLRGNLHAHTTRSDGARGAQDLLDRYAEMGYDFLAVTDHDIATTCSDYQEYDSRGLVLIPGNEITADGAHLLHIDLKSRVAPTPDRQVVLNAVERDGGFAILNHPNWLADFNHCPFELMKQWQGYTGIEIYNGTVNHLEGSPYATDKWDRLLSNGIRAWGFANDDTHIASDEGLGWNVVWAKERSPRGIVDALRQGRFYASTGVAIDDIEVVGDRVSVVASSASRIAAFTDNGVRVKFSDSGELTLSLPDKSTYVRFECIGDCEARAWTQPFFAVG